MMANTVLNNVHPVRILPSWTLLLLLLLRLFTFLLALQGTTESQIFQLELAYVNFHAVL
jgi:hypothetical protein